MKKHSFPALPAALCLTGLLFCLWGMRGGGASFCLTTGCALFQNVQLAGISLWHAGSALFILLLALCLARLMRAARVLALAAVLADTALLAIMLFTAPCVNCLIAGAIIALACLCLCRTGNPSSRPRLLTIWLVFLLLNIGNAVHGLAEPWSPMGEGDASTRIYFSPSCPACQVLASQAAQMEDSLWFPVPEDERDIWIIHEMLRRVELGMPLEQAMDEARRDVPESTSFAQEKTYRLGLLRPEMLLLQFRMWKNRAHVLASGSDRLPFVEFRGLPAMLAHPAALPAENAPPPLSPPGAPEAPMEILVPGQEMGVAGFCGGEENPCAEPAPIQPRENLRELMDGSGIYQP